jgi:hypothetical protein
MPRATDKATAESTWNRLTNFMEQASSCQMLWSSAGSESHLPSGHNLR